MRNIVEVRLKNRLFGFIDIKGNFIDFLIKETKYENIKLAENRIDVASKDLSESIFFSWENFGFQIDAVGNFKSFKEKNNILFSLIKKYGKYNPDTVVRIGAKSSILSHQKGKGMEAIKQKYKELFFKDNKKLEKNIGFDLTDVGYFFQDLEKDGNKLNLLSGPATKKEAIIKFFGGKEQYKSYSKEDGIYLDIDYYQLEEQKVNDLDTLKNKIDKNIDSIEKIFQGFIQYIEDK